MGLTRPNLAQVKTINANFTDALGVLNRTATGTNTKDLGWVFNRGSDTNQVFLWDESADEFVLASTSETGTTEGDVTLSAYADLQIGRLISNGLVYPTEDGTNGQILTTDGNGNLSFADAATEIDLSAVDQHIIPDADVTYDLGSPTKQWKDIYVGPGSLYVNGQKVLEDNSGTITFSADTDQSLSVQTTGTGVLTLQSAQTINVAGTLQITSTKRITDSAGVNVEFGDAIHMNSNKITNLGTPTSSNDAVTKTYVDTAISNLVDTAPEALNTLNELASALGDDANFSTTISTQLGQKANTADLATVATSGSYTDLSNKPTIPSAVSDLTNDNNYISLTDLSISTASASGSGSLSYNNSTGVFTFTPADLSQATGGTTYTASSSAPSSPNAGDEWYDTDDGSFYKYINDGTSSQWVEWTPSSSLDGSEVITGNILPETDSTYNIGSGALQIATIYADSVTGLGTPSNDTDAATKGYVDDALSGISSDKITEGNSNVEVIDNGTGSVVVTLDASTHTTFNSSGITLSTGNFVGTATTAQYADLAENYLADAEYAPGTVVILGGNAEITQCTKYGDSKVAGIVSTNPAYLMNSDLTGEHVVSVALTGRVPCRVRGNIEPGDLLVTGSTPGVAQKFTGTFYPGIIIGKAIQSYSGADEGIIEVLVGRS
jgi:hypothetical protein